MTALGTYPRRSVSFWKGIHGYVCRNAVHRANVHLALIVMLEFVWLGSERGDFARLWLVIEVIRTFERGFVRLVSLRHVLG